MININEINDEIEKLEHSETTYRNCEKLSILYAVRNNFSNYIPSSESHYSYADESSEFVTVAKSKPLEDVLTVLDAHMEVLKMVYPKDYNFIMQKLREV